MATSYYEYKKLKVKPVSARIVESTAVRVLAKASKKLSSGWKKFLAIPTAMVDSVKLEAATAKADDIIRITNQIDNNQNLINLIKEDKQANSADYKVMAAAQKESEKLEGKLEKLEEKLGKYLNKKVKVETIDGESFDLNEILNKEGILDAEPSTYDEIDGELNQAGIPVAELAPVVEQTAEPVADPEVKVETVETPIENKEKVVKVDPAIEKIINTYNDAKKTLEQNVVLSRRNQDLEGQIKDLAQQNSKKDAQIASLTKEKKELEKSVQNQAGLEQKLTEYESIIARQEKERIEMSTEVEKLKFSTKENLQLLEKLEKDMDKIVNERDFYKTQILALKRAIGYTEPTIVPTVDGENKVK